MSRSLGYILLMYLIFWYSMNLRGRHLTSTMQDSLENMGKVMLVIGIPALLVVWIRARTIRAMLLFLLITVGVSTVVAEAWYAA